MIQTVFRHGKHTKSITEPGPANLWELLDRHWCPCTLPSPLWSNCELPDNGWVSVTFLMGSNGVLPFSTTEVQRLRFRYITPVCTWAPSRPSSFHLIGLLGNTAVPSSLVRRPDSCSMDSVRPKMWTQAAWLPRLQDFTMKYSCCCCCSVVQSSLTLWDPMDYSMPSFPVLHHLLELAQTHFHWFTDAIQPSPLLSSSSPSMC